MEGDLLEPGGDTLGRGGVSSTVGKSGSPALDDLCPHSNALSARCPFCLFSRYAPNDDLLSSNISPKPSGYSGVEALRSLPGDDSGEDASSSMKDRGGPEDAMPLNIPWRSSSSSSSSGATTLSAMGLMTTSPYDEIADHATTSSMPTSHSENEAWSPPIRGDRVQPSSLELLKNSNSYPS